MARNGFKPMFMQDKAGHHGQTGRGRATFIPYGPPGGTIARERRGSWRPPILLPPKTRPFNFQPPLPPVDFYNQAGCNEQCQRTQFLNQSGCNEQCQRTQYLNMTSAEEQDLKNRYSRQDLMRLARKPWGSHPGWGSAGGRVAASNGRIMKTRGVPSAGSSTTGPRGQSLAFRNFEGGGMTNGLDTKGIQSYILGLVSVGVLFFVIGYGYEAGKEKA